MNLIITTHARERFLIRRRKDFIHLEKCKVGIQNCHDCNEVSKKLAFHIRKNKFNIDQSIFESVEKSSEEKALFNNNNFMQSWYEQHGYNTVPSFFVDYDLVYVILKENGKRKLLTCIDAKTHKVARHQKFKLNKSKK